MAQPMMTAQTATAIRDTVTKRAPLACTSYHHVTGGIPAYKKVALHGSRLHSHTPQRALGARLLQA